MFFLPTYPISEINEIGTTTIFGAPCPPMGSPMDFSTFFFFFRRTFGSHLW